VDPRNIQDDQLVFFTGLREDYPLVTGGFGIGAASVYSAGPAVVCRFTHEGVIARPFGREPSSRSCARWMSTQAPRLGGTNNRVGPLGCAFAEAAIGCRNLVLR